MGIHAKGSGVGCPSLFHATTHAAALLLRPCTPISRSLRSMPLSLISTSAYGSSTSMPSPLARMPPWMLCMRPGGGR